MIEFRLSVDALGNTRFGYSPLAEVVCSLRVLGSNSTGHILQPWLQEVRDELRSVDLELLRAVAPPGRWAPDCLFIWSPDPKITVEQQLEILADVPPEAIRADLQMVWAGRRVPAAALRLMSEGAAGGRRLADAIWDYWQVALGPYWVRIRSVLDDDVSYRGGKVLSGGLYDLLCDLHPEVSLHDRVLLIDKPHHADETYTEADLTLIPSVFAWPNLIVGHDTPGKFELVYTARGVGRVWEGLSKAEVPGDALGALLGRNRAAILNRLHLPMTTTQLARELHQSPGTVSEHLSVLRRNGLLTSWRSGHSVLYRRTPLASSIIAAGGGETGTQELA